MTCEGVTSVTHNSTSTIRRRPRSKSASCCRCCLLFCCCLHSCLPRYFLNHLFGQRGGQAVAARRGGRRTLDDGDDDEEEYYEMALPTSHQRGARGSMLLPTSSDINIATRSAAASASSDDNPLLGEQPSHDKSAWISQPTIIRVSERGGTVGGHHHQYRPSAPPVPLPPSSLYQPTYPINPAVYSTTSPAAVAIPIASPLPTTPSSPSMMTMMDYLPTSQQAVPSYLPTSSAASTYLPTSTAAGAAASLLEKKKKEKEEGVHECVICMEEFTHENPEMHTLCNCGENRTRFHYPCLLMYLQTKDTCPTCRGPLFYEEMN